MEGGTCSEGGVYGCVGECIGEEVCLLPSSSATQGQINFALKGDMLGDKLHATIRRPLGNEITQLATAHSLAR